MEHVVQPNECPRKVPMSPVREKEARRRVVTWFEQKSRKLYQANQKLVDANACLREKVPDRLEAGRRLAV